MIMRLTPKFLKMLPVYLEWAKCSTPYSRTAWGKAPRMGALPFEEPVEPTAAQVLFKFESLGEDIGKCSQPRLLGAYLTGKANRDFWTKEIGWWRKWASFIDEEFCEFLMPDCFFELFGHYPRTHLVRHFYDNSYKDKDLESDCDLYFKGLERVVDGLQIRAVE